MNVEFLMAARDRLVYRGRQYLSAAIHDLLDADDFVATEEELFKLYRGNTRRTPIDAVELAIADRVDQGETLPVTNPEGYGAARWLAQSPLASLPDPIPRAFVLYLAQAYHENGSYATLTAALTDILTTRTFS